MTLEQEPKPNYLFAFATVVWALAVGLVVRVFIGVIGQGMGGKGLLRWLESTPVGLALVAATIQLALFGLVGVRAAFVPSLRGELVHAFRTRKSHWAASLLFIIGIGPFANLCGLAVAKLTHANLDSMKYIGELIRRASLGEFLLLGVVLTVLPAIVEESLFRGLVFRSLRGLRAPFAIGIQALAFGVFHLDVAQGVATAVLGLGFGYIAYRTGSLKGSMVAHAGYNLMVLLSQRWLATTDDDLRFQLAEVGVGFLVAAWSARSLYRANEQVA